MNDSVEEALHSAQDGHAVNSILIDDSDTSYSREKLSAKQQQNRDAKSLLGSSSAHRSSSKVVVVSSDTCDVHMPGAFRVRGMSMEDDDDESEMIDDSHLVENPIAAADTIDDDDDDDRGWVGVESATPVVTSKQMAVEVTRKNQEKNDPASKHDGDSTAGKNRRKRRICVAVALVVLVSVVVGVAIVLTRPSKSVSSTADFVTDKETTISSTLTPTQSPSITSSPTRRPKPEPRSETVGYYMSDWSVAYEGITAVIAEAAELESLLHDPNQSLTVLAISDGNMLEIDFHTGRKFLAPIWRKHALEIVRNHIVPYEQLWSDIDGEVTVTSLAGFEIILSRDDNTVNGIALRRGDRYIGNNGVLHQVKSPIFPPWFQTTLLEQVMENPDVSIFASLVSQAGLLEDLLDGAGPTTVFAPHDSIFDDDVMMEYVTGLDLMELEKFVQRHVYATNFVVTDHARFGGGDSTLTELYNDEGTIVLEMVEKDVFLINNVTNILSVDHLAENGILHVIDGLM